MKASITKQSILRENQALLLLDDKGRFVAIYALRQDKVYKITMKGRKQIVSTHYLEDLATLLKGKG